MLFSVKTDGWVKRGALSLRHLESVFDEVPQPAVNSGVFFNMIPETGDAGHELDASLPRTRVEPQPLLPDFTPMDQTHEWAG